MKIDVDSVLCENKPTSVELDTRYKVIGISAVAAAIRYNRDSAASTCREAETSNRFAA